MRLRRRCASRAIPISHTLLSAGEVWVSTFGSGLDRTMYALSSLPALCGESLGRLLIARQRKSAMFTVIV